jgi:hypothetical protein
MTKIAGSGSRIRIRIRIRIHWSEAWIRGSGFGSTPKCHGSATLLEIQSVMMVFSTQLCELCTVLPLLPCSLWFTSPTPPSFPKSKFSIYYMQTVCGWEGVEVLSCVGDHILQEFNTLLLTRFRTYKIATPPHTKT